MKIIPINEERSVIELSPIDVIRLRLFDYRLFLFIEGEPRFSRPEPFYLKYCGLKDEDDRHGYFIDNLHGWRQEIVCPRCEVRRAAKLRRRGLI